MPSDVAAIQIFLSEEHHNTLSTGLVSEFAENISCGLATREKTAKTIAYRLSFVIRIKSFIDTVYSKTSFVKINCITY